MHSSSAQSLIILNHKKESITGKFLRRDKTKPLLIICHGYASSMEHPALKAIAGLLYERGYNVYTFNFSKSAQTTSLEEQVMDIQTVVKHFSDYKEIILIGGSLGALSAAIAAQQAKHVTGLVTVNGFFGTRHLGPRFLKIYVAFKLSALVNRKYKKILDYIKNTFQPTLLKKPVLVIHSPTDPDVSIKQSRSFYEQLPGKKMFSLLKDADHDLTAKQNVLDTVGAIDSWIQSSIV